MRQVFSSSRLENVEGIAKMLEAEGIEVRITHGRSYKGGWGGRRPYREADREGPLPAVWVVRSEDQPRARQLLRDAGLLDSTRGGSDSFLPDSMHGGAPSPRGDAPAPQRRAFRYKIALLIGIVVAVGLAWNATRKSSTDAPATARAPAVAHAPAAAKPATAAKPVAQVPPNAYPVDTPPALATTLATTELEVHATKQACLQIDGAPASEEVLAAWKKPAGLAFDCTDTADAATLVLDVRGYRTDGSGTGTVELAVTSAGADGHPSTQVRTLLVRRTEADWRVLRVLDVH